ncbi:MAG: glutathione S-transferase N-terminal domain-containing protein [Minwuia sp.]|nr:glutathione S-transferase N-terminal domain-containing protein [Minwuia sp.]
MKLLHAQNSPYARRARLAARFSGLKIEELDVSKDPATRKVLDGAGPSAKIPGLLLDDGTCLCETLIIGRYIDAQSPNSLMDYAPKSLELEGIASVLMDATYKRIKERLAEDGAPSPTVLKTETDRITRCYDALDARLSGQSASFNLATIAAVSALGYADWRGADDNWREGRDGLTAWYDAMMENKDIAETAPIF